jgi:histidyl-tRNA synthetase
VRQSGRLDGTPACDTYVVHQATDGDRAARLAFRVSETLRNCGIDVITHCGGGSFKSQMKKADGSGAEIALIIGDDELAAGEISIKTLRREDAQERVTLENLAARVVALLPESNLNGETEN